MQTSAAVVSLRVERFEVRLRFTGQGRISAWLGNTLRGGFGKSLRETVCALPTPCAQCQYRSTCAYGYLFETPVPADSEVMRLYPHAPHPFVLEPPDHETASAPEHLDLGVVLVDRAIKYLPYVIQALSRLGAHGLGVDRVPFTVERVIVARDRREVFPGAAFAPSSAPVPSPDAQLGFPLAFSPSVHTLDAEPKTFRVVTRTPLAIQQDGRLARDIDFKSLISAICRRADLLSHFHGAGRLSLPVQDILRAAEGVEALETALRPWSWDRFSARQNKKMPLQGLMGSVKFRGRYSLFLNLLRAGEVLHVGKHTAFGLGRMKVEEEG